MDSSGVIQEIFIASVTLLALDLALATLGFWLSQHDRIAASKKGWHLSRMLIMSASVSILLLVIASGIALLLQIGGLDGNHYLMFGPVVLFIMVLVLHATVGYALVKFLGLMPKPLPFKEQ